MIDRYITYVCDIRRYSRRTADIYRHALEDFVRTMETGDDIVSYLKPNLIRTYQRKMLERQDISPATVNLHMSALSGFCRFLVKEGLLKSNPVSLVRKPKVPKRLPVFFRKEAMDAYFKRTDIYASKEYLDILLLEDVGSETFRFCYEKRLSRLIISILYGLGVRRSELISLDVSSVDFGRKVVKVHGKGDKTREIPIIDALCEEILLYLKAVEALVEGERSLKEPLLVTFKGKRLYPVYVDRVVKSELSAREGHSGRKSPHVLRHTLATELMNDEADLNSIKELLGHSSLAATQVYTHNSVTRLKNIYKRAHPRAKNGGKHGD